MTALHDALRRGVNAYPGGRPAVGTRLDGAKKDEVLRKELGGWPGHKLGAVDALAVAVMCCELGTPHCYDYPAYVAQECGGKFVPLDGAGARTSSPVEKVATLVRETSDVTTLVIDSMSDGKISDNELAQIECEIAEAEEVLRKLRTAARAVNAAGKPAAARATA